MLLFLSLVPFLLRYSIAYAVARPSVRPSVRRVDHSKTIEVRIMKFSPYSSPISLVFPGKFHQEILMDSPSEYVKQRRGGKTSHFLALNVNISKTEGDTQKLLLMTNRKLYTRFRLAPRSMTLDDLELL